MHDEQLTFLHYVQRELSFLRRMSEEFTDLHGAEAGLLGLDPKRPSDPHVERLMDGFAILAARIHERLDSTFPEVIEALFESLYPGWLASTPSRTIIQFMADTDSTLRSNGITIPRGSYVRTAASVEGGAPSFRFRTSYETVLWPLALTSAKWNPQIPEDAAGLVQSNVLALELRTFGKLPLRELVSLKTVRVYLDSTVSKAAARTLYELLFGRCRQILIQLSENKTISIGLKSIRPVGFEKADLTSLDNPRIFWGMLLWQEYFAFPERFMFFDLDLERVPALFNGSETEKFQVLFLFSDIDRKEHSSTLERQLSPSCFKLGCVPATNLFDSWAEPIVFDQNQYEYPLNVRSKYNARLEILTVKRVIRRDSLTGKDDHCLPLLAPQFGFPDAGSRRTMWCPIRREIREEDRIRNQVFLSFVNQDGRPQDTYSIADTISTLCACSDGEWPLQYGVRDFMIDGYPQIESISGVLPMKGPISNHNSSSVIRRMVSNCALNFVSFSEGGVEAIKQVLRTYNFSQSSYAEAQISAIAELKCEPCLNRIKVFNATVLAQGTKVRLSLIERNFDDVDASAYLFCSILERFLGLHTTMNSFTQLYVRTDRRQRPLSIWPPRTGWKSLV